MPPLSPNPDEDYLHLGNETDIVDDGLIERGESQSGEGSNVKGQGNGVSKSTSRDPSRIRSCITSTLRLSRTILASEKTFVVWNMIISTSYTLIFVTPLAIPNVTISSWELSLWMFLAITYFFLLLSLTYAASLLGRALLSGIERRKNAGSLAFKLVGTSSLLAIMLMNRVICFSMVAYQTSINLDDSQYEESVRSRYRKTTLEYVISESLPILLILFMMHRKKKEVTNDVLIHSILNNLFGSSGRLCSTDSTQLLDPAIVIAPSSSAENVSVTASGGGLGSRRVQTYGGTRGDSIPPPGYKPKIDVSRAVSSDSKI